jgi:hypothetical protein
MSANILLSNSNQNTADVSLGYNTARTVSAFQPDALAPYEFPEPKTGLFATVFPGESTWHSLYDHDYREIANHIFSIGTMEANEQQKQYLMSRVKNVTIDSYEQGAMGNFYKTLIVGSILLIILVYFESSHVVVVGLITAGLAAYFYIYATVFAKGYGETYWQTFYGDLNSKLQLGKLPGKILEEYGANVERERDRLAMARVQRASNNSAGSAGSAAFGAFAGGLLGGMFR